MQDLHATSCSRISSMWDIAADFFTQLPAAEYQACGISQLISSRNFLQQNIKQVEYRSWFLHATSCSRITSMWNIAADFFKQLHAAEYQACGTSQLISSSNFMQQNIKHMGYCSWFLHATSCSRISRMWDIAADFEADTSKSLKGKGLTKIVKVTFRGLPLPLLQFTVFLVSKNNFSI